MLRADPNVVSTPTSKFTFRMLSACVHGTHGWFQVSCSLVAGHLLHASTRRHSLLNTKVPLNTSKDKGAAPQLQGCIMHLHDPEAPASSAPDSRTLTPP
jgi:hypothetical protein